MTYGEYQCLKCGCEFQYINPPSERVPIVTPAPVYQGCPDCGHLYLKWLNQKEFIK